MNAKKIFASLVLVAAFFVMSFSPAQAKPVKLDEFTCEAFNALGESQPYMIFWFHGYVEAAQEIDVFDDEKITKFAAALVSHCKANASEKLEDALLKAIEASK